MSAVLPRSSVRRSKGSNWIVGRAPTPEQSATTLSAGPVNATIPAIDFERAKWFYRDVLGVSNDNEAEGKAVFGCGSGTCLFGPPNNNGRCRR